MTAATSSGDVAGRASATEATLVAERAAAPAPRRTSKALGSEPRPTRISNGDPMAPEVGIFTTSPALPVTPREERSGAHLRP